MCEWQEHSDSFHLIEYRDRKNAFHKNKQRCRDATVYPTFVPA